MKGVRQTVLEIYQHLSAVYGDDEVAQGSALPRFGLAFRPASAATLSLIAWAASMSALKCLFSNAVRTNHEIREIEPWPTDKVSCQSLSVGE
jgi:hypothetical protein